MPYTPGCVCVREREREREGSWVYVKCLSKIRATKTFSLSLVNPLSLSRISFVSEKRRARWVPWRQLFYIRISAIWKLQFSQKTFSFQIRTWHRIDCLQHKHFFFCLTKLEFWLEEVYLHVAFKVPIKYLFT